MSELKELNKKRVHRGWLNVDYDDNDGNDGNDGNGNTPTYKALVLENQDTKEEIRFDTGNIVIDYVLYTQYINSSKCC